jgi:hypothetical protein
MTTQTLIELRKLAEAAKGWKLDTIITATEDAPCKVGSMFEGEFYPLIEIDCEDYYGVSNPVAQFIVEANPTKVIELLDALEARDAEIERLKKLFGDDLRITDLGLKPHLHASFEGGPARLMAEYFVDYFKDSGAENYIEMTLTGKDGLGLIATIQRHLGKTPHQLRLEAEAERDSLRAELAALKAQPSPVAQEVGGLVEDAKRLANLREAAWAVLSNEEHAFSGGMRNYQIGSPTWQVYQDLRTAAEVPAQTQQKGER